MLLAAAPQIDAACEFPAIFPYFLPVFRKSFAILPGVAWMRNRRRFGDFGIRPIAAFLSILTGIVPLTVSAEADSSGGLPPPSFENPGPITSQTGYFRIAWSPADPAQRPSEGGAEKVLFELQQGTDSLFTTTRLRYQGPDQASFLSGLRDGAFFFRVRAVRGAELSAWSPVLTTRWSITA